MMRAIRAEDWLYRQLSAVMSEAEAKRQVQILVSRREKQYRTDSEIVEQIVQATAPEGNAPTAAD